MNNNFIKELWASKNFIITVLNLFYKMFSVIILLIELANWSNVNFLVL